MNILITGAAGFLGLHLANFLHKKGFKLTLLDINEFNKREYPKNCRFVKVDIRNKTLMFEILKDVEIVIHAAAALPLWSAKDIYEVNIDGTRNLLEASVKNNIGHFIYISSTAVYGIPKRHPIYEKDSL